MTLEKELQTYQRELPVLLRDEGKYVLIQGDGVSGIWGTYEDALQAGYQKFGLSPFLVKKIEGVEVLQNYTRDIRLCQESNSQ